MTDELSKGFTGIEINGVRFSNIKEMLIYMNKQRDHILDLEKENAELKSIADFQQSGNMSRYFELKRQAEKLEKAKEILKAVVDFYPTTTATIFCEAEQFLKEVENV